MEEELLSEEQQKEIYPHSDTLRINERHVDFGKAWEGARTVQNWKDPWDVTAAGAARVAEFIVPQTQEEWMFEMATLGQGKKINLGRKLAHAAIKDIPVVGDIYAKGTKYVSSKLDDWFDNRNYSKFNQNYEANRFPDRPDRDGLYSEAPTDTQSMWNAQQRKLVSDNASGGSAVTKGMASETGETSQVFYQDEFGDVLANADPKNVELLKKIGLDDNQSRFVLDNYYKIDRDTAAAIENLGISVDEFNDTKEIALPYLLEAWSNIKRKRIPQLDHVNQLKAALPFFTGRQVQEFPAVAKILVEEGVFGGHSRKNFKYLEFDVHSVKSAYWLRKVGGNGEKFFAGKDISTPEKLRAAAKEYAKIIKESNDIVNNAIEQYKFMNKIDISETELDEFVSRLGSERIDPKHMVKQVRALLTEMEEDGFIQTPKSTKKIEKTSIKQEKKEIKAAEKKKEQLIKDDASVERRMEEIQKYISTREKTFKGQYPLGLKDEQLHFDAETIVKDMKKNRALRENIQGTIFDQENEAAQIEAMKKILWERTGRSRNK